MNSCSQNIWDVGRLIKSGMIMSCGSVSNSYYYTSWMSRQIKSEIEICSVMICTLIAPRYRLHSRNSLYNQSAVNSGNLNYNVPMYEMNFIGFSDRLSLLKFFCVSIIDNIKFTVKDLSQDTTCQQFSTCRSWPLWGSNNPFTRVA